MYVQRDVQLCAVTNRIIWFHAWLVVVLAGVVCIIIPSVVYVTCVRST